MNRSSTEVFMDSVIHEYVEIIDCQCAFDMMFLILQVGKLIFKTHE